VLKQISSHRWRQMRWGLLKASNLMERYASMIAAIIVPSQRLMTTFAAVESEHDYKILHGPKGFDPMLLADHGLRRGPELVTGWAGAAESADKHVDSLLEADPKMRIADRCLTLREMSDFYNGLDVIAIASSAEGDPRPLIEGMACGCFPVSTDVGIVPELVVNGENGIILGDRAPECFREAFAWCRENLDHVRRADRANAELMRRTRTWAHVAPAWGDAIDIALQRAALELDDVPGDGPERDEKAGDEGCFTGLLQRRAPG
jgi:hypothetical protein